MTNQKKATISGLAEFIFVAICIAIMLIFMVIMIHNMDRELTQLKREAIQYGYAEYDDNLEWRWKDDVDKNR